MVQSTAGYSWSDPDVIQKLANQVLASLEYRECIYKGGTVMILPKKQDKVRSTPNLVQWYLITPN